MGGERGPGARRDVDVDPRDAPDRTPPWTRQQAEAWRREHPASSPWRVVAAQALAGIACAVVVGVAMPRSPAEASAVASAVASAFWGGATAVLPSALLARGMTRRGSAGAGHPLAAALGFMFWIVVKIGVSIAMLAIASRVVPNLSWPALLVTLFVCIKVNWVALLGRGRPPVRPASKA